MRSPLGLILACGASVLLHGVILGSLVWTPPVETDPIEPPLLYARLLSAEPAAPVPPTKIAPKVARPVQEIEPRPGLASDTPAVSAAIAEPDAMADSPAALREATTASDAENSAGKAAGLVEISTAGEPAEPDATEAPAAAVQDELSGTSFAAWPTAGSIRFQSYLGEAGFLVGEARHEWWHDGERYRMSLELETTGLAGLMRNLRYAQRSEGRIGPAGLRPEAFHVEQTKKKPAAASFDWNAGVVTLTRGSRVKTAPIAPGDQDVLSLWHQIGIVGVARGALALTVVSGHEATASTVSVIGGERLTLPIGRLDTLRVRAAANDGRLTIDLWLAREYGMLPVRIRIVDDKGEVMEQRAIELQLTPPGGRSADDSAPEAMQAAMIELRMEEDPAIHLTRGN